MKRKKATPEQMKQYLQFLEQRARSMGLLTDARLAELGRSARRQRRRRP